MPIRRTEFVLAVQTAKNFPVANRASGKFFKSTVASGADPGTADFGTAENAHACGSVTNASSYGDFYEGASYACAWRFYGVYVFFRKAYCYKLMSCEL